ncbi:MAG: glycosyltransferase family 2 protein [candidate division WOR-3 bacterium]
MLLSVIIPAYNEESSIRDLIERVKASPVVKEIIVVDDHSSDHTLECLQAISGIKLLVHSSNCGKGAAIRTALSHARGDIVIVQDADLEYDPSEYPSLLVPFSDATVDAVYGSRFRRSTSFLRCAQPPRRNFLLASRLANVFLTFLTNVLFGSRVTDMETCYKAIRRAVLERLNLSSSRFEIEPEITAKLSRLGCRIAEVPISYNARRIGKKIGARDGFLACCCLIKWYLA